MHPSLLFVDHLLEQLLDSVPRARVLRLFLQNTGQFFAFNQALKHTRIPAVSLRKELITLVSLGVLKKRLGVTPNQNDESVSEKKQEKLKKTDLYSVNPEFPLLSELRDLVVKSAITSRKNLIRDIKKLGKVKLALISGVFLNSESARTDLLIVGDDVRKRRIDAFLSKTESELGVALRYTLMETDEFKYRLNMYDRFLKDILEYRHEKLINKLDA